MVALGTRAPDSGAAFRRALAAAERRNAPFRHWLLRDALDADSARELCGLPIAPLVIAPTLGKRETNNALRRYFNPDTRERFPLGDALAHSFQTPRTIGALEEACAIHLRGSFLRIEYCQDVDGFWLEPHTDISTKLVTVLIYLSDETESRDGGTDLYDAQQRLAGRAPFGPGRGLVFVPGVDTWHGFSPRPIQGVRRSLIINYVTAAWRARHELAFPGQPIG